MHLPAALQKPRDSRASGCQAARHSHGAPGVVRVAIPSILQCVRKLVSKTISSILTVQQNGGHVGNTGTGRPYRFDCLEGSSGKRKHKSGIELNASFEM